VFVDFVDGISPAGNSRDS